MPHPFLVAALSAGLMAAFGYSRPRRFAAAVAMATLTETLAVLFQL